MQAKRAKKRQKSDPGLGEWQLALENVSSHPLFASLAARAHVVRVKGDTSIPSGEWAVVTSNGTIRCSTHKRGAGEWAYVIAHCLLHLGMGHFREHRDPRAWNLAADLAVQGLLEGVKFGTPPLEYRHSIEGLSSRDEEKLYRQLSGGGGFKVPDDYQTDLVFEAPREWMTKEPDWPAELAHGLARAVTAAVDVASGERHNIFDETSPNHPAESARRWFVSSYPLLATLAAAFKVNVDPTECRRRGVDVAMVDFSERTIFVNPLVRLDAEEMRFVIAHELLHVGLRHGARCGARDPLLWNVACDYVINGWLTEMGVGRLPGIGLLYDPKLKGSSAEEIYESISSERRRYEKLAKKAGANLGDFAVDDEWWRREGVNLDDYVRRALAEGLERHREASRGWLPLGLEEEIWAQAQKPIEWEVELANWFDAFFAPVETTRSYARPSRRQASTPDIPRPRVVPAEGALDGRTFGVVIDTSGSMDRVLLGRALGAAASYATSREVPKLRVVFCDAAAYDAGYMSPEEIAGRVRVKGGGGTVLQPGVELLEEADDFPKDGPILIITDAWCDHVRPRREHAYLTPPGEKLPFVARGPVFEMRAD